MTKIKGLKCALLFSFLFLSIISSIKSQDFLGATNMSYGGVTSMDLQPASIVDMRYRFDMTLFGFSTNVYNNYIGLRPEIFWTDSVFREDDWQDKYLVERESDDDKFIYINNQIQFPSMAISLGPRMSIGLSGRMRTKFNMDNVSPELAKLIYEAFDHPPLWQQKLENNDLSIQVLNWAEYGLTFGMVLADWDKHFLKGAVRGKLLQGIFAGYLYADELSYEWTNSDTLSIYASNVSYGHSDNFEIDEENIGYPFTANPTIGFDFGLVYEYRPNRRRWQYEHPEGVFNDRRDREKYAFRLGLSLLDVGRIRFNKHPNSRNFFADIRDWDVSNFEIENVADLDDTIGTQFTFVEDPETDFFMTLPTVFSLQADVRLWRSFFLNVTPYYGFRHRNQRDKVREINRISIAPRFDSKWFGIAVPFSFVEGGQRELGATVRLGPLIVGSNNLLPLLRRNEPVYGADVHAAIKIPIPQRRPRTPDPLEIETIRKEIVDTVTFVDTVRIEKVEVITVFDTIQVQIVHLDEPQQVVLQTAFDNLEFESGQAIIKARSFRSLENLASLLNENPDWMLSLEGHTDNVGSPESNMRLSRDRAMAVKRFLTDRGVEDKQILVEYFGETRPIASNDTAEGRQRNRRVEMEIVQEIKD